MLVSISEVVGQFKRDWTEQLSDEAMAQVCRDEGMSWRQTLLNPITTLKLFLLQILHGNTAMTNLRHLSKLPVTASAYCQARFKIPLAVCQRLLKGVTQSMKETVAESACWHGHRLFYVDGSSFSMPDTAPLQAHFGQPGGQQPGCGFPVAHFLALTDAATGLITEVLAAPLRTHDMSGMVERHPQLQPGDVLAADRAFCSFAHVALLTRRGVEAVLRMHQRQIVDFTPNRAHAKPGANSHAHQGWPRSRWLKALGFQDQVVEGFKPSQCPSWLSAEPFAELPDKLIVRERRYRIECPGFRTQEITLVTTLIDANSIRPMNWPTCTFAVGASKPICATSRSPWAWMCSSAKPSTAY